MNLSLICIRVLQNYVLAMISDNIYRKYFSISPPWLFSCQIFQQGERNIHIYVDFSDYGNTDFIFILQIVEINKRLIYFSKGKKNLPSCFKDEVYR